MTGFFGGIEANDGYEEVISVDHGPLRFLTYEANDEGMERVVYASDWEPPGTYIEGGEWREPDQPDSTRRRGVEPAWIEAQRQQGWPDMHPEDYCHRCGTRNPSWCASAEDWATATAAWSAETGREGICCPACFQEMYESATGRKIVMVVAPWRGSWEAHKPTDRPIARETKND